MMDFWMWLVGALGGSLVLLKGFHEVVKTMNSLIDLKLKLNQLKELKEEGK
jgi:hypothetical protein